MSTNSVSNIFDKIDATTYYKNICVSLLLRSAASLNVRNWMREHLAASTMIATTTTTTTTTKVTTTATTTTTTMASQQLIGGKQAEILTHQKLIGKKLTTGNTQKNYSQNSFHCTLGPTRFMLHLGERDSNLDPQVARRARCHCATFSSSLTLPSLKHIYNRMLPFWYILISARYQKGEAGKLKWALPHGDSNWVRQTNA